MAKYGGKDLKIEFDNAAGSLVDMSQYITELGGIKINAALEDSHAFGDAWGEKLFSFLRSMDDITGRGFYDDTASTGPDVIFNDVGNTGTTGTRTLKVTWGGTKTTSVETWIMSYSRIGTRGALTQFEFTLSLTGAPTEA